MVVSKQSQRFVIFSIQLQLCRKSNILQIFTMQLRNTIIIQMYYVANHVCDSFVPIIVHIINLTGG